MSQVLSPIGTLLSKTCKPTFVHLPIGSRLIPRLMRACARSFLLVRKVLVRMVTGRGTSLASKNSIAYGGVSEAVTSCGIQVIPHPQKTDGKVSLRGIRYSHSSDRCRQGAAVYIQSGS
jgi:hypothetical protein